MEKAQEGQQSFTVADALNHAFMVVGRVSPLETQQHCGDTALAAVCVGFAW